PDFACAERLHSEKRKQHDDGSWQYICPKAWRNLLYPLKRRQYRYCRSDSTVAVNQSCTEQSGSDDCGPVLLLHSKQREERNDAALAVIVDTHREVDILDGGDNEQGPQDQG